MPSLKDIKRRIKSVKNTQQITKAMKMVSAAKLKRAQDEIVAARPYAEKMIELISTLSSLSSPESHPLLAARETENGKKICVVLLTSDRGLCGSFNTVLLRITEKFLRDHPDDTVTFSFIGKRGAEYFKRRSYASVDSRNIGSGRPKYGSAAEQAQKLINSFLAGDFDEVHLVYSKFKSALSQTPTVQRLLPISAPEAAEPSEETGVEIFFEPSAEAALSSLLPRYIEVQVFRALLESSASEHGARMSSMDSASKNAAQMIGLLTLKYNRLRQAAITKELMEIIGGAEALKG